MAFLAISIAMDWPVSRRTLAEYYFNWRDMDVTKVGSFLVLPRDWNTAPVGTDAKTGPVDWLTPLSSGFKRSVCLHYSLTVEIALHSAQKDVGSLYKKLFPSLPL